MNALECEGDATSETGQRPGACSPPWAAFPEGYSRLIQYQRAGPAAGSNKELDDDPRGSVFGEIQPNPARPKKLAWPGSSSR